MTSISEADESAVEAAPTVPPNQPSAAGQPTRLKGHMGVFELVMTVLAFNAPLAVMAGFVPVVIGLGNHSGAPMTFALLGVVYLIFAAGLTAMARYMKSPGAFYSYIVSGLGKPAGLGGAFLALATYLGFAASCYPYLGILTNSLVHDVLGGPLLAWWVWPLVLWAAVTGLSMLNVEFSAKVLGVTMCAEVLLVVIWETTVAIKGGPAGRGIDWFSPSAFTSGSVSIGLLFTVLCVTGFEAVAVFREETRDPVRNVPRATYAAVIVLVVLYGIGAWAYLTAFGPAAAVANGANDPSGSFAASVGKYVGVAASDIVSILLVTSVFSGLIATHNIAARYLFTLGRDHVLPRTLGTVHRKHGSPHRAAATVGGFVFLVVLVCTVLGIDPLKMYTLLSGVAGVCLVLLMTATAAAIVFFFRRRRSLPVNRWRAAIAPSIAFVALCTVFVLAAINSGPLVGGGEMAGLLVLTFVALVALAGVLLALFYRRRAPAVYTRIGGQDL